MWLKLRHHSVPTGKLRHHSVPTGKLRHHSVPTGKLRHHSVPTGKLYDPFFPVIQGPLQVVDCFYIFMMDHARKKN